MSEKMLKILFNEPLRPEDTETQTYGCRQNNPSICGSQYLPNVCAFTNEDCICYKPSRAWKKQYKLLKEREE